MTTSAKQASIDQATDGTVGAVQESPGAIVEKLCFADLVHRYPYRRSDDCRQRKNGDAVSLSMACKSLVSVWDVAVT